MRARRQNPVVKSLVRPSVRTTWDIPRARTLTAGLAQLDLNGHFETLRRHQRFDPDAVDEQCGRRVDAKRAAVSDVATNVRKFLRVLTVEILDTRILLGRFLHRRGTHGRLVGPEPGFHFSSLALPWSRPIRAAARRASHAPPCIVVVVLKLHLAFQASPWLRKLTAPIALLELREDRLHHSWVSRQPGH